MSSCGSPHQLWRCDTSACIADSPASAALVSRVLSVGRGVGWGGAGEGGRVLCSIGTQQPWVLSDVWPGMSWVVTFFHGCAAAAWLQPLCGRPESPLPAAMPRHTRRLTARWFNANTPRLNISQLERNLKLHCIKVNVKRAESHEFH